MFLILLMNKFYWCLLLKRKQLTSTTLIFVAKKEAIHAIDKNVFDDVVISYLQISLAVIKIDDVVFALTIL